MPVREALRRLAAENALEVSQSGSARVPTVTVARLDDICRARVLVEGLATELAAQSMSEADIQELEALLAEHEAIGAQGNVYDMLDKNRAFHFAVYRASRSDVLIQLIDTLWLRHGPYMRMLSTYIAPLLSTGLHEPFTQHHRSTIRAIRNRDAVGAREEIIADIRDTQDLLRPLCA